MKRVVLLFICLLGLAPASTRADGLGIVLIHGKQGTPDQRELVYISQQMEAAHFLVDKPTMCWSRTRIYDRSLLDCMADIDASIAKLKSRGATAFVVAGQSLGAFGAILYGSLHDGLKGVVALAPAPGPRVARRPEIVASLQRAQTLIAGGHGDEAVAFEDSNTGRGGFTLIEVRATPNVFMSFFDMSGPANLVTNTTRLKAPVLWVSGTKDASQLAREIGFDKAPSNPLNRYAQIDAAHMETPDAAADIVVAWLKEVAKN